MASDSSTSTTPLILTPESTGTSPEPSASTSAAAKKARRQTAFYPNVNSSNKQQKPFSRSAAKRESVMTLGSIEHLQYYFTKTGIAAKKNPHKQLKGLVPALGGLNHIRSTSSQSALGIDLPPTPTIPEPHRITFPPSIKTFETDPDSLLPGVVEDLNSVAHAWHIDDNPHFDVLSVLKQTINAVRSVRNYVVSLPDESAGTIRAQFRSNAISPGGAPSKSSSSSTDSDPLTLIRRSALQVLTVLRALEETSRLPLSDDAYDAQSDGRRSRNDRTSPSSGSSDLPPSSDDGFLHVHDVDSDAAVSFSLVKVQGRYESVPVWEDDAEESPDEDEHKERWDERLVIGNGWLYRQDIKSHELEKERQTVTAYLDLVDEVLFEGKKHGKRGWDYKLRKLEKGNRRRVSANAADRRPSGLVLAPIDRRVSTGMINDQITEEPEYVEEPPRTEDSIEDDDLPDWAKRDTFFDDDLARAHSLLSALLPPSLLEALAPPSPKESFLDSLSSGQLLCVAYNAGVRKSKKPWGFVSKDGIHDILKLEKDADNEARKKGWTFRRTDNLRLWVGALKLRYVLPIVVPAVFQSASSPGPTQTRFPSGIHEHEPPIHFDAKVVARKEEGWESMLETVLVQWMNKVVDEHRVL